MHKVSEQHCTISFMNIFQTCNSAGLNRILKHFFFDLASLIALLSLTSLYNGKSILPHAESKANLDVMRPDSLSI